MPKAPTKSCARCGREIIWRKRWERCWEEIRYCGERCRRTRLGRVDEQLEEAILRLLGQRAGAATICPSEAARDVAPDDWRPLMERVRMAARRLVARGELEVLQKGRPVDPSRAKGPIRLRRKHQQTVIKEPWETLKSFAMPEGPEIRRAADRIASAIEGQVALELSFAHAHLQCYEEELAGQRVDAVETRGKALLIRFEGGLSIYSHNQLYGRWYVRKHGSYPRTGRQLRLAIHTEKKSALLYSASDIAVLDAEGIREHPFLRKLGPDILDPELRPARIAKRLQDAAFAGRQLGSLLLDQGFLAGNGNYLRSEILFVAGLLPLHRPKQLEDSQLQALARAVRSIARRTYKTGGITNDPQLVQQAKARGETRSQYRHFVFARAGKPCRVCGTAVEREDRAGRRLYYCPHCQL